MLFNLGIILLSGICLLLLYIRTPLKQRKYRLLLICTLVLYSICIWLLLDFDWKWAQFIIALIVPLIAQLPRLLENYIGDNDNLFLKRLEEKCFQKMELKKMDVENLLLISKDKNETKYKFHDIQITFINPSTIKIQKGENTKEISGLDYDGDISTISEYFINEIETNFR